VTRRPAGHLYEAPRGIGWNFVLMICALREPAAGLQIPQLEVEADKLARIERRRQRWGPVCEPIGETYARLAQMQHVA
jgi:hypothetical protein